MEKVNVGTLDEFPTNQLKSVNVKGRQILIINANGKLFASDVYCTHARVRLDRYGILSGATLECDAHGAKFSCETGKAESFPDDPAKDLFMYKIEIENNNVIMELP